MITLLDRGPFYFDVDDTLVMWRQNNDPRAIRIGQYDLVPHAAHIEKLKRLKTEFSATIVVWSAGGGYWAKTVIEALGLESFVDLCVGKPSTYYDDLRGEDVLGPHCYLEFK